jgi:hypothetical protein
MIGRTFAIRVGDGRVLARIEGSEDLARRFVSAYDRIRPARGSPGVVVRWSGDRGEVLGRACTWRRSNDPDVLLSWAEWVVTLEALPKAARRWTLLHAAWVAHGGRSVLLAGPHGAGKTTLGAALSLRHGWRLLSDDMVLLSHGGLRPFERPVRIKPGGLRVLPEARRGMQALSAFGGRSARPRLTALVFLERWGARPKCDPVAPGLAVAKLARLSQNLPDAPSRALRSIAALAARVPAYALGGGSLEWRCSRVSGLLRVRGVR